MYQPYFAAFEAYLVRRSLEPHPDALKAWLANAESRTDDDRLREVPWAAVALGGVEGATRLAQIFSELNRAAWPEEVLLLATANEVPAIQPVLTKVLTQPANLRLLYDRRGQIAEPERLAPALVAAARNLVAQDPSPAHLDLLVKLATGFRLSGLETELVAAATQPGAKPEAQLAALRALRESGSTRVDVLRQFGQSGDHAVQREAVTALAAARSEAAVPALLDLWPSLSPALRKIAVDGLSGSPASARRLVAAVAEGSIRPDELDGYTLDKLAVVLPNDTTVQRLQDELGSSFRPVLRLNGGPDDYVATELTLAGPFTVETWIKLDPGINNQDSILAAPDQLDANFHEARFRVWIGGGVHDIVTATKPIVPEAWTHVAFTRDDGGTFRIYLNGELDAASEATDRRRFERLDLGRSNASGGTAGEFAVFRVWNVCRTPDEIRSTANVELSAATPGLIYSGTGQDWGSLRGQTKIERTGDVPPVVTEAEAQVLSAKFAQFRPLAGAGGDVGRGQQVFAAACGVCHTVKGGGGKIGPALDGAGAHGPEALLRNVLTPNAAMEAGYRMFRVETRDGDLFEGLLVAQDTDSVTLRQPNTEDQRFLRGGLQRAGFLKTSVMPEGLLEALPPDQVRDLLAYVLTLK